MTTIEVRSNFHKLIDKIENKNTLSRFYEILLKAKDSNAGDLWKGLSKKEQDELLEIEKESYDTKNLISHKEMKSRHKKWL